jgi:DNA-binding transcriptional LysR family regulator
VDLLAQMATFVRVVDGKSLSAAARSQRLSLAAVSRQLQALEAELRTPLIVRSTRRLHVTEAGSRWYEHCRRVLREVEEARASMSSSRAARGRLVVSASLTFGSVVLIPRLRVLSARHPELTVDLHLEDQLVDLVGEGVDVVVRAGSMPLPDSPSLVAHALATMDRVVVAAPRWLRKHGTPRRPSDLASATCLVQVTRSGGVVRWQLRRGAEEVMEDARGPLRVSAPLALRDLAVDGAGLAYLPDWLVEPDLVAGRLRRVLPGWASAPITAYALHRAELRGAPRLVAFLEAVRG